MNELETCEQCEGDGDVLVNGSHEPCPACGGTGLVGTED